MSHASSEEQALLKIVLEIAKGNLEDISKGVQEALKDTYDRARRTYLWNELRRRATASILRKKQVNEAGKHIRRPRGPML